jgi:hypothetical protein
MKITLNLTDDQALLVSDFIKILKTPTTPEYEIDDVLAHALTRGIVDLLPEEGFFNEEFKKNGGSAE